MRKFLFLGASAMFSLAGLGAGCDSTPQFVDGGPGGPDDDSMTGGNGGADTGMTNISFGGDGASSGSMGTGGTAPQVTTCGDIFCNEDKHCEEVDGELVCVENTCEMLGCSDEEECVETSGGAHCESLACDDDLDCRENRFCDTDDICKDDTCTPGTRSCSPTGEMGAGVGGDTIYICPSNGSAFVVETTCRTSDTFTSTCQEPDDQSAGCGCDDDWDCPGFQECDAGSCTGSIDPPSCRLPPADISTVLPIQEIVWGTEQGGSVDGRLRRLDDQDVPFTGEETGAPDEPPAVGLSPWSDFAQVTQTPIVANLDDDNGDSIIDDRDTPEILFITFAKGDGVNNGVNDDGVLRVIHGGGEEMGASKKGQHYLATCGDNRYFKGTYYDKDGVVLPTEPDCDSNDGDPADDGGADLDAAATIAVGDLNYDGVPEIVVFRENSDDGGNDGFDEDHGGFIILSNEGVELFRSPEYEFAPSESAGGENPGISLANVVVADNPEDEMVEIMIGRDLFTIEESSGAWSVSGRYSGTDTYGSNQQGPFNCIADLIEDRPGVEIVAGGAIYGIPLTAEGALDTAEDELIKLGDAGTEGFCAIADIWGETTNELPGPSNPLDGKPEIILIIGGSVRIYDIDAPTPMMGNEWAVTLTEVTALNGGVRDVPGASGGGPPNVDDFDGDGFPEVGTAGEAGYIVFDFQASTPNAGACPAWSTFADPVTDPDDNISTVRTPPAGTCTTDRDCNGSDDTSTWLFACNEEANVGQGACICLHNGWRNLTQDGSSEVTGSSVFDFNGDSSAEVVYNDECHFRIYSGLDGAEIFVEESESRTRTENPIVADVDNDGNAEIVFSTTTESGFCSSQAASCTEDSDCPSYLHPNGMRCDTDSNECVLKNTDPDVFNSGIEVWGDPSDQWVSARRVWNQYSYHVTNVSEDGSIPRIEPNSWEPVGSRFYNTYRSQPRSFGSAPDLVVDGLQVIAPGTCGASTNLTIGAQIRNAGDLRVSDVPVRLVGIWDGGSTEETLLDSSGDPIEILITQTLEPGASVVFQVEYEADSNTASGFPESVRVVVDDDGTGNGIARECNEDNNEATEPVDSPDPLPDLRLVLNNPNGTCPPPVSGTVFNESNVEAVDVIVRIYAGDPATGASSIGDLVIGSVPAGESVSFDDADSPVAIPLNAPILLYGEVDPDDTVTECNENNNLFGPTTPTACRQVAR